MTLQVTLQVAPPGSGFRDASGDAAGCRVQGGEGGGWYLVRLVEVGFLLFVLEVYRGTSLIRNCHLP